MAISVERFATIMPSSTYLAMKGPVSSRVALLRERLPLAGMMMRTLGVKLMSNPAPATNKNP